MTYPFPNFKKHWRLGMDKYFNPTLYWACDYLSMPRFKLNHVRKRGPCSAVNWIEFLNIVFSRRNNKNIINYHVVRNVLYSTHPCDSCNASEAILKDMWKPVFKMTELYLVAMELCHIYRECHPNGIIRKTKTSAPGLTFIRIFWCSGSWILNVWDTNRSLVSRTTHLELKLNL